MGQLPHQGLRLRSREATGAELGVWLEEAIRKVGYKEKSFPKLVVSQDRIFPLWPL